MIKEYSKYSILAFFVFATTLTCAQKNELLKAYIFFHTECPISQAYIPTINHLMEKYPSLKIISVFTKWDNKYEVAAFLSKYNLQTCIIHDKKHKLVNKYSATTTPEVVLINKQKEIIYQGLIDNHFISLGKKRETPTISYLDSAFLSYKFNQKIKIASTVPIGCKIEK